MHIKSMSWSTRRISEESVYSYRVSTCRNDCISCIVSTGCVLIDKNEPRKYDVSGVLLCVFLQ